MKTKLIAVFSILLLAVLACGLPSTGGGQPTATIEEQPIATVEEQPTATVGTQSGSVLFHDDFSDTSSGWYESTDSDGTTAYYGGGFRILVKTEGLSIYVHPFKTFQDDVRIEVDATKSAGPDNNAFGILCRYQDKDNFYGFVISSDGYAGISKRVNGKTTLISSSDNKLQPVDHINQGGASNHIRADCIGSDLTLYVNGSQIAAATDSSSPFSGGDEGLFANTPSTGGVDILFKDFYVYAP